MQENMRQLQRQNSFCPNQPCPNGKLLNLIQDKGDEWYVFVTCSDGADGKLSINMSSYGDPKVLAFILEDAMERLFEFDGES